MAFGLFLLFLLFFAVFGRAIYSLFDHTEWDEDSEPDLNAKITDVYSEKVQYVKNGMKYKTTVTFSDGFNFITHKTNREDYIFTYQISMDEELKKEIISKAVRSHKKAVEKRCKENLSQKEKCNDYTETKRNYSDYTETRRKLLQERDILSASPMTNRSRIRTIDNLLASLNDEEQYKHDRGCATYLFKNKNKP